MTDYEEHEEQGDLTLIDDLRAVMISDDAILRRAQQLCREHGYPFTADALNRVIAELT